jgi:putative FmdB family regulatory protein
MPLYEYECLMCGHRFERIQRFSDSPVTKCSECGGAVRRLLGIPALQFRGSGFYITDYGKSNGSGARPAKAAREESAPAESTSEPAATKDSDAKPAARAARKASGKKTP